MKNKIFVTGFQRGGTTLVRRLLHNHPEVECMIHERRILNRAQGNKDLVRVVNNYKAWEGDIDGIWGEKIPWNSATGNEVIKYMTKWKNTFSDSGRYINIIRNPFDTGMSNQKLNWISLARVKSNWQGSMPKVIKFVESLGGINIVYEDLLLNPKKVLKEIFKYCELDYSEEILEYISNLDRESLRYFNKIESSRAFVHTTKQEKDNYMEFIKEYWIK